jgi:hypothetical protein
MLKATTSASADRKSRRGFDPPDLPTQFESLLDQVCASEPDHCGVAATAAGRPSRRPE